MSRKSKSRMEEDLTEYLETFSKNGAPKPTTADVDDDEDDEEGSYFIDEAGNYYYRATKDSEPVLTEPPEGFDSEFMAVDEDADDNDDKQEDPVAVEKKNTKRTIEPRRSTRPRKQIKLEEDPKEEPIEYYVEEEDDDEQPVDGAKSEVAEGDGEDHLDEEEEEGEEVNHKMPIVFA